MRGEGFGGPFDLILLHGRQVAEKRTDPARHGPERGEQRAVEARGGDKGVETERPAPVGGGRGPRGVGGVGVVQHIDLTTGGGDTLEVDKQRGRVGRRDGPGGFRGEVVRLEQRFDEDAVDGVAEVVEGRKTAVDENALGRKGGVQPADDRDEAGAERGEAGGSGTGGQFDGVEGVEEEAVETAGDDGRGELRDEKIRPARVGEIDEIGIPRGVAPGKGEAAGEDVGAIGGVGGDFADTEVSEDGVAGAMGGGEVDGGVGVHDGERVGDKRRRRDARGVVDVERQRFRFRARRGAGRGDEANGHREGQSDRDQGVHGGPAQPVRINSPSPVSTETSARKPRAASACAGAPSEWRMSPVRGAPWTTAGAAG